METGSGKKDKKKNKFLFGIIASAVGTLFPAIIVAAVVSSGVSAVVDFVEGVGEKIGDLFVADDVLAAITNEDLVSDKDLEAWMITRNSMTYLLTKAEEFNNREPRTKDFTIEGEMWWSEYVPDPTPVPEVTSAPEEPSGTPAPDTPEAPKPTAAPEETESPDTTPAPEATATPSATPEPMRMKIVERSEIEKTGVLLSEDREIIERYKVSWQLAYMLCIYQYMDTYDTMETIVDISNEEIDGIMQQIKPEIVYEFDPIKYWENTSYLTENDVASHPHDLIYYDTPASGGNIVDNVIHHRRRIPKFRIQEVLLPYGKDIYEYETVVAEDGSVSEILTYYRVYDKQKFLSIVEPYLGDREIDAFMVAFEYMPEVEELYAELETVMRME